MSAAVGCSPHGAQPQADGRPEQDEVARGRRPRARPRSSGSCRRTTCPRSRPVLRRNAREEVEVHWRDLGGRAACPGRVDVDEEVPGDPEARKMTAVPLTIWSARRWMEKNGVHEREQAARHHGDQRARRTTIPSLSAPQNPEEGAHQHHALEADVHDAAPLREDAAERREDQRRRERERRARSASTR